MAAISESAFGDLLCAVLDLLLRYCGTDDRHAAASAAALRPVHVNGERLQAIHPVSYDDLCEALFFMLFDDDYAGHSGAVHACVLSVGAGRAVGVIRTTPCGWELRPLDS